MTYEQMHRELDAIADDLPGEIYTELNGGIILSPDTKIHPQSAGKELLINGEYHNEPYGMGRYIVLYYGSLIKTFGHLPEKRLKEKIKEVLYHELTHHLESMAGDKSLEIKDSIFLEEYKGRHRKKDSNIN